MKKIIYTLYAGFCYAVFLVTFLYLVGFVENLLVPRSVDSIDEAAAGHWFTALLINLGLISLFGIQHSVMARQGFKQKWKQFIPAPVERSTYVLFTSIVLVFLYRFWQPLPFIIWDLSESAAGTVLLTVSFIGWGIVLLSTFLINHFHLFGLYQVYQFITKKVQHSDTFSTPLLYRIMRHPLYLGFLIAFWAAPVMTAGHLFFALAMTAYILIGIHHEEKDLVNTHGESYKQYAEQTPKLIPFKKSKASY
jgi:methanethiol S-methyltransferase